MELGRIGVWGSIRRGVTPELAAAAEELGYGTLWLGSAPMPAELRPLLEATSSLVVATGIVNVWQFDAEPVAADTLALRADFPERFLLGVGIGHPETTKKYRKPLPMMRDYLDGLAAAGVPREGMVVAALGPKMLDLAAERTLGTHPYFVTPDHTRFARERVGPEALVAPEVAVVVEEDAAAGRAMARQYAKLYLGLQNYTGNLLRFGFTEEDIAGEGSDRLIDAVVPHGSPEAIAEAVRAHLDAGADHVCVQPVGKPGSPLDDLRALAAVLR